jgi:hypothetical protein
MAKVYTGASMSLDGYISGPAETGFEHLFKWYGNGDVVVPTTHPDMTLHMSAVSAQHFRNVIDRPGHWSLAVGCSIPRTAGAGTIRWDDPWSWSPTACRRAGRAGTHRSRSSTAAPSPGSASTPAWSTRSGSISSPSRSAAEPRSSTS